MLYAVIPAKIKKRRRWESNPRWRICNQTATPENAEENGDSGDGAAPRAAVGAENRSPDAELTAVIEAWPTLPEPIKSGILAMVQSWLNGGNRE